MYVPMQMCGKGEKETCSLTEPCALGLRYKQYKQNRHETLQIVPVRCDGSRSGNGSSEDFNGVCRWYKGRMNYVFIIIIIPYFTFMND